MKVNELAEVLGATRFGCEKDFDIAGITIDSKEVIKNSCYIALIGKVNDGHDYIKGAIKKGAKAIVVSKLPDNKNRKVTYLLVDDTNEALLDLGRYMRELYQIPLIAITGSVGKTTTKELLYEVLKGKYQVLKSPKNYNNRIGVPLSLLNCKQTHQLIIMEMGMNHEGEIRELSKLCKPDVSIITNIGTSHIGLLNGQKNIYKAKAEILEGMRSGYVVVNGTDPYLKRLSSDHLEVIKTGKKDSIYFSNVKLYEHMTYAWLHVSDKIYPISFMLPGSKMLDIILLVVQTGLLLQVPIDDIITAIERYQGTKQRLERISLNHNVTLIDDSYNASKESILNMLSILNVIEGKKLLILGDILELGKYSKKIHKKILREVKKIKGLEVYLVGKELSVVKRKLKHGKWFLNVTELNEYLHQMEFKNMTIVVKGSNGIHLDIAVKQIKKSLQ